MMSGKKFVPYEDMTGTLGARVFGGLFLLAGLWSCWYGISPDTKLFLDTSLAQKEVLASRCLYIFFGLYSLLFGIFALLQKKKEL